MGKCYLLDRGRRILKRTQSLFCFAILSVLLFLATAFITSSTEAQNDWTILFQGDFADGTADGWHFSDSEGQPLATPWPVEEDGRSLVLSGSDHTWAYINVSSEWSDYSLEVSVKLISGGLHLNYRLSDIGRYFIGFSENGLSLHKQIWPDTFYDLGSDDTSHDFNTWYIVKIVCAQDNLKVYVDGTLKLEYSDPDYLRKGSIAFETLDDSHIHFDDLVVVGEPPPIPPAPPPLPSSWTALFEDDFEDESSEG